MHPLQIKVWNDPAPLRMPRILRQHLRNSKENLYILFTIAFIGLNRANPKRSRPIEANILRFLGCNCFVSEPDISSQRAANV
jgi:hypothetical protein